MKRAFLCHALAAVLCSAVALPLTAQGWIEPTRPFPIRDGGVVKVRGAVQVAVTGRVARVTVEEWFRNAGGGLAEGSYLYPLPGEAVFSNFSLWQGDQELRGETMDANQARSIYETIVRQKRDPALIELAGHGLIRARVFPINPGETRKITLRYTQILDRIGDAWRLRYAAGTVAAPRSFRITVDSANRFAAPYSPTHRLRAERRDEQLEVTLSDSTAGTGDLELFLPLSRGLVGTSLVTRHPAGEDGYFMLLLAPGVAAHAAALRRDVVAVVDVSGSMSGEKVEQAKAALRQLLGTLRGGDRFRLVAFSSDVRRFRTGWTALSDDTRRDADAWIRSLEADGGTNIAAALREAFVEVPAEGALGVVVFLTDGLPSVGENDPERLAAGAEQDRGGFRVFAFGIGHDVNTFLLDRLTERARGITEYIRPGGDIESAVGDLSGKIASPVLTDLALDVSGGGELYDVQPGSLPDLFGGDELVVFGRYRGVATGEWAVTVRGRRGGQREEFRTTAIDRENPDGRYIEQLWAARKAGALSREIRLHGQTREIMDALKALGLRYGILTEFTSYLVQEPTVVATQNGFERVRRLTPAAAPAPRDQAGAAAVAQAQEEDKLAQSVQIDGMIVTGAAARADSASSRYGGRGGIGHTQRVGGRLFLLRDSVWTDLRHGDSLKVVTVAPFSQAYFALMRVLPELVQPAKLDPAVLVAGRRLSIKIEAGGRETWGEGELATLARDFRE